MVLKAISIANTLLYKYIHIHAWFFSRQTVGIMLDVITFLLSSACLYLCTLISSPLFPVHDQHAYPAVTEQLPQAGSAVQLFYHHSPTQLCIGHMSNWIHGRFFSQSTLLMTNSRGYVEFLGYCRTGFNYIVKHFCVLNASYVFYNCAIACTCYVRAYCV